jgi:KaiC/GvpD/RAD55 family RecA-like ATPase
MFVGPPLDRERKSVEISAPTKKLAFTQEIENKAIKIILTDLGFVNSWVGRLKEEHFSYAWNKTIFKVVREFQHKNKKLPTRDMVEQGVHSYLSPDDNLEGFYQHFSRIFDDPVNEAPEIKELLMDHMKKVDYDAFLLKFAEMCRDGQHDKIKNMFEDMVRRHATTVHQPKYMEPGNTASDRVKKEIQYRSSIPSPWPTFNANNGGGFQSGTLNCFMGPTGSGKSILLVNVGAHALRNKKTVYHFTFELSHEKTAARYDVVLTGATHKMRLENPGKIDESIREANIGDLHIIEYPTDTCSASKVRATIDEYVSRGNKPPDIIILDYLTIMNPSDTSSVDMRNEYAKLKQIAEDVRGFAMDAAYNKPPIISALQSNRGAEQKTAVGNEIKKSDVADSYALMGVLDVNLTINQSSTEKQTSQLRLYSAKARDNVDGYTITCDIKYECLQVTENIETTAKYQAAAEKRVNEALQKGQIPPALDPESLSADINSMVSGMGVRQSKSLIARASPQDVLDVTNLMNKSAAPPPIVTPPKPPEPPPIQPPGQPV